MTEPFNEQPTSLDEQTALQQLIERLKPLHVILSQNSYVKDTTTRLKRIIDDASSQPIVLFIGKERVGKTTLINSLIGRNLLEDSNLEPTSTNTFLKYGEQECIKAVFLDGMVATFDISNLKLLTVSNTESAQIIREHIDYLEVYIKHDLLKEVTIVDSMALEAGANNTAYFSHSLLQRVDEVFWVLRGGSEATEAEVNLIHKLNTLGIYAHLVVNGIDQMDGTAESFIEAEKKRYGAHLGEAVAVSALQALQARRTNDTQLLIDSRITQLSQLMHQLISNKQKKTRHITELFIYWLDRMRKEVESIPSREPYISAFENVEQYHSNTDFEFTRQQRDFALIASYEEEYENVSKVFKEVQTLYQLLQKLASDLYLRDSTVEKYEEIAGLYQKNVRDYRKLHVEYTMEFARLEKQFKKQTGKSLAFPLDESEISPLIAERIDTLNKIQAQCEEKIELIEKYEQFVCKNLYTVQNRLNELAANRLATIINQASELNLQRKRERTYIKSYANKLAEFNCIVEAQSFLKDAVQPCLLDSMLPITEQEKGHIRNTIECITAVDLTHKALYERLNFTEPEDLLAQMDFETKYRLIGLSLTEADVVSDIPELPKVIEI
ncbi:dynamin family protein [Solibacillus silvestris]|uniref:dynamin family protein n=1 Tax=Solibacillus silvestris TaxID=76853 RepID=UPI003F810E19